jgi:hypothetical protein
MLVFLLQGKYYLFIEVTSQLHRQLAPLQPWLMYLLHSKGEGPASIPNKVHIEKLTCAQYLDITCILLFLEIRKGSDMRKFSPI